MFEKIQKLLDRIESRIALWQILSGSGIVSAFGLSAWFASAEAWLSQYGFVAWWFAGLLGALIATLVVVAFAWSRFLWAKAEAMRKWKEQPNGVNPLETEFHKSRISVQTFVNPANPRITGKKFYDCELVGPANIYLHNTNLLVNSRFFDCDFIVLNKHREAIVKNAIALEGTELHQCHIICCTFLVETTMVSQLQSVGVKFLTLTEDQGIAPQPRRDIEQKTPP